MINIESLSSFFVYIVIFGVIILRLVKGKNGAKRNMSGGRTVVNNPSSMPHTHREPGYHDTYNRKTPYNTAGAQPHVHETRKYKSMADASQLPKGYILLNGEPVRVADLEGK